MVTKPTRLPEPRPLWNVSKYVLADVEFGRQNKSSIARGAWRFRSLS